MLKAPSKQSTLETKARENFLNLIPCTLCGAEVLAKNIRQKNPLCYKHEQDRPALERKNYFRGTTLNPQEREAVIRKDPTLSKGPYFKMKKGEN